MEKSGKPYIHKPDGHEEQGDELYCAYDDMRVCNAACVAFDIHGSGDEKRTLCILVNAQMQQAAALVRLTRMLGSRAEIPGSNIPPPGV